MVPTATRPDPRVQREARSLAAAGCRVTVLCWDRMGEFQPLEQVEGVTVRRIGVRSRYSLGSRQVWRIGIFWLKALGAMAALRPDAVHCHDLDTVVPGLCYAFHSSVPWIYDAHECYPEQIRAQVHWVIYRLLLWMEKFSCRKADRVVTVGERLARRFRTLGARVTVVGNYPLLVERDPRAGSALRADMGIPAGDLVVACIGGFTSERALLPLIRSTRLLEGVGVLLAGDGPQRNAVECELPLHPSVRYLGWVPHEFVEDYIALSDIVYYGLRSDSGNSHYSAPNMLFTAMALGKPVIATPAGEIAEIVKATGCGVVAGGADPASIAEAVRTLTSPEARRRAGENGRIAAESRFNWASAEEALLSVYAEIEAAGKAAG